MDQSVVDQSLMEQSLMEQSLMEQSQQAYYLKTLGIVQYVPRDSVAVVDEPTEEFNQSSGAANVDRQSVDVAARINLNFDAPAASKKAARSDSPNSSAKPTVALAPEVEVAAALIEVKFALWQPSAEMLVCSAVEGALADADEMQLLTNILNALGCGIKFLPQMELVEWPPYPNAEGDESEVREFLSTLLQARLDNRPVKFILMMGEAAADWLLSPQQRTEQSSQGHLSLNADTTALLLPSLKSMIDNGQLKASAWQVLKSISLAPASS